MSFDNRPKQNMIEHGGKYIDGTLLRGDRQKGKEYRTQKQA